ncbi:hypothetical protein CBR_g49227 [Chara braunii]|uniref:HAT C-terminal dimerisation domain-containing protein n=1 Tax=Chara braunii TaxID=69332 RepID=A0A388M4G5_CHABU|nr:hypothetical protein CBR_g49227 [Chara braunii]|eukprot:GBG89436.1 hypothetical protein CBR_g49227 [Chara braunii]
MDPSLSVPQDKVRQDKLQREKPVWKYAEQGQEAGDKGRGEYCVRFRLCTQIWRGTCSRTVEHYLKPQKPCPLQTGEIMNELITSGGKVQSADKNMRYMLKNYRQLHGILEGGVVQTEIAQGECFGGGGGEAPGSNTRLSSLQQSTIRRWVDNDAQKKLDIAWAEAMFRVGIPFNFLNFETTKKLHEVGGEWKRPAHIEIWGDMNEFHYKPTRNGPKRNDTKTWDPTTKLDVDKKTPSEWWAAHGGDMPELQKIAIKVMGMWSTASPTERNWASMDFVHSKRRNKLSPESLAKLVYIHWNMQLLHVPKTKNSGFVDSWCDSVEPVPEPEENNGSKWPEDEDEKTEEELVREWRLTKTPKERVPKNLEDEDEDEDEELTGDNDLDNDLWKGKCGLSQDSSGTEEEVNDDSDFKLRPEPAVSGTTYVEKRQTGRQRREEPRPAVMEPGVWETAPHNPQFYVEFARLDTDVETLLQTRVDTNEEDVNRAKAMADREIELVNKHMMEEEARCAAIPTRREIERGLEQSREHQQQVNRSLEVVEDGEEEEEEEEEEHQAEQEEEAEGMVRRWSTKKRRKVRCKAGRKRKCGRKRRGMDWHSRRCSMARSIRPAKTIPIPQRQQSTHAGLCQRRFRNPRRRYRDSPQ